MYIRKTRKSHKGKTYTNYLLVESVSTPKGPRQRIICSLGSLAPAPSQQWLDLAHRHAGLDRTHGPGRYFGNGLFHPQRRSVVPQLGPAPSEPGGPRTGTGGT